MNSFRVTEWQDHRSNGGTGVTKTRGKDTASITEAVKAFGDPSIFMKGTELHTNREVFDLGDFWRFYDQRTAINKATL